MSRSPMSRSIALTTLALLAVDGLTTVIAPATGMSFTNEAQAADDDKATVKKAKIKQKTTSSGGYTYTFWLRTGSTGASTVGSADVTLTNASTGELLQEFSVDEGLRGRLVFTGQFDELAEGSTCSTVTIGFETADMTDSNGDPFGEQQEFEVSVDCLEGSPTGKTAEDTTADGWKIRTRINTAGELTVVLANEDRDWAGAGTVVTSVSVDGGDAVDLDLDEVRQRFKSNLSDYFVFEDDVIMKAEVLDADGNVLDTLEKTISPPSETAEPALSSAKLKESKKGQAKLVTWTESDGQAAALEVDLVNNATGESIIMTTDDTPVVSSRSFSYANLEFEPGESPADYTYLVLIDLIDSNGDPYGEQYQTDVRVPRLVRRRDRCLGIR